MDTINRNKHPFVPRQRKKSWRRQSKKILTVLIVVVLIYTFIILFGEFIFLAPYEKSEWCQSYDPKYDYPYHYDRRELGGSGDSFVSENSNSTVKEYENPDYITDPCRYERLPKLFWLTLEECDMSRRMLTSVILGSAIGYERRASDRPAGIRTMGLVSLGSCFFSISGQLALKSSTMGWDSSRITAAIPSGVGFLGSGLIVKGTVALQDGEKQQVHGLTTAASLWLSAAVGVGCGGALYFPTAYGTILVVMVLRYGPKLYLLQDSNSVDEEDEDEDDISITEDESSDTYIKNIAHIGDSKDYADLNSEKESESIDLRGQGVKHDSKPSKGSLSSTINSYDTFGNPDLKRDNQNLSDTRSDGHTHGNIITSHYDQTPTKSNLILLENKEQNNLRVAFNSSVENIDDINAPQTMLNIPPDKKITRQRQRKTTPPSFHG